MKLFSYQSENVNFCLKHKYVLVGDEMGLGKTVVAIDLIRRLNLPTLVICPSVLKINWQKEVKKFIDKDAIILEKEMNKHTIGIISYDMLPKNPQVWFGKKLVICDESHFLKEPSSLRTKTVHKLMEAFKPDYFLMLSGTPIKNRVYEFYSPLSLLSNCPNEENGIKLQKHFRNMQEFLEHFSFPIHKFIRGRRAISWEGIQNIDDLKKLLLGKFIRHTCEQCLDLPPLVEIYKAVSIPKDMVVDSELLVAFQEAELSKYSEFISTVKRGSAMSKTLATSLYVENIILQSENPVLIFSDHVDAVRMINKLLSKSFVGSEITGVVSMDTRQHIVEKFQKKEVQYLVCTIAAMGFGWTLTAASHVVFNDVTWVPADLDQAMKRIHRIGQEKKCFVHYLHHSDVDKMIYRTITSKRRVVECALKEK